MTTPRFHRYIGIDYSGAACSDTRLGGLRVYQAQAGQPAQEVLANGNRRWTRRELADWLGVQLQGPQPLLIGIDHGFGFPQAYFRQHRLAPDWSAFIEDFCQHWPGAAAGASVRQLRRSEAGNAAARAGNSRWRRLCEVQCGAKSVFHFDVPGSVASSTHAGLPWLAQLRRQSGRRLHVWPFDGWLPAPGVSLIAEVYPSLWNKLHPTAGRSADQHDAWSVARWLQQADRSGALEHYLQPALDQQQKQLVALEGWILGLQAAKGR